MSISHTPIAPYFATLDLLLSTCILFLSKMCAANGSPFTPLIINCRWHYEHIHKPYTHNTYTHNQYQLSIANYTNCQLSIVNCTHIHTTNIHTTHIHTQPYQLSIVDLATTYTQHQPKTLLAVEKLPGNLLYRA